MIEFCVVCQKEVDDNNWKHRNWGGVEGWGCSKHFHPKNHEFTTEAIKEERYKHRDDIVQPWRQGEFSQEFKEANPETAKEMLKDGRVSQKEYDGAKSVWKGDVEGY